MKRKGPTNFFSALFPFPPTSLKHDFYGLTSGFTRLIMKTKYVCHGLISLHGNFHDNRTKLTATSNIKICRWGVKEKEPFFLKSQVAQIQKEHKMSIPIKTISLN